MEHSREPLELSPENLQFIENIAVFYEAYGIPRIGGRIFGLLLIADRPLPAETIAGLLSASRGSISTNMQRLITNGWVEKVTFTGDRAEYFRFSPLAWERVLEHRMRGLAPLKQIAAQGRASLPAEHPARPQLDDMLAWVELQIQAHKTMIEAWQKQRGDERI